MGALFYSQSKCVNRRIDPESGKIYDISDGGDLPDGVDAATLVQRADDKEDKVRARLEAFAKERDAVCGIFNDIVHTVDGNQCVSYSQSPPWAISRSLCAPICVCTDRTSFSDMHIHLFARCSRREQDEVFAEITTVLASVQP